MAGSWPQETRDPEVQRGAGKALGLALSPLKEGHPGS